MRICVNDYAGHPFQVQLSRTLAQRGHDVLHTYCSSVLTPRGTLAKMTGDPDSFNVEPMGLRKPFDRYRLFTRPFQERELGQLLAKKIAAFKPDAVVSANTPLGAQSMLFDKCAAINKKFIFWVQDLLGVGIKSNAGKKIPIIGDLAGRYYVRLENTLLRKSDNIVIITEDFRHMVSRAMVSEDKIHVIRNWAPLEEIPVQDKANPWSIKHGLADKFCFIYSGTMGMKHNPELLVQLSKAFKGDQSVAIVVISEGLGAEYLKKKKASEKIENLLLLPFQPFEILPMVLGSADVLLAILEADAGLFAVPSKVLTSLCAQRPLLLSVPLENLAARIVNEQKAGFVVAPDKIDDFISGAKTLVSDKALRRTMANNGRLYAENTFDIQRITDQFEKIILS
ncbi:MAG: glycosyltransferase family 4 protein [Desulfatitalea sp.]|nr:glycosyltransferase family 4 protein [Desulfatitalea sp.]